MYRVCREALKHLPLVTVFEININIRRADLREAHFLTTDEHGWTRILNNKDAKTRITRVFNCNLSRRNEMKAEERKVGKPD